jgi:hypothetical protein
MPWHKRAMKDVASCEKPRGGASNLRSVDFRMGQPNPGHAGLSAIWRKRTWGSETSKYLEEQKEKFDFLSSGERNGNSLNLCACMKSTDVVHQG